MKLFFRLITVPLLLLFLFAGCADINWDPPATPPQNKWTPPPMTRGLKWVRNNPMFISALTVAMGNPPSDFVNEYFNRFNANAVHLWQNGLPEEMDAWKKAGNRRFRFVSWVLPDGTSEHNRELIGGYPADKKGRIGYQIGDEPRTMNEFLNYQTGFASIRKHDPDALLILNFSFMAPEINRMLEYYGENMDGDVISHDVYTWTNSIHKHLAKFRRAGLRYNQPYWRYLTGYFSGTDDVMSKSDLRWEAFTGLVYGFTGHTWFVYQIIQHNDVDPAFFKYSDSFNAPKTRYWGYVAQINKELAHLGRAITQMLSTDVRYVPATQYYTPPNTFRWSAGAGSDPYITQIVPAPDNNLLEILIGFFRDDSGEFYTMVQNVRHTHGDFPTNNSDPGTIRISFNFENAPDGFDPSRVLSLDKMSGKVKSVPLTHQDGELGYLDIRLAAGDPFLFKYATGVPFALQ